jgi:hypothetical protein
MNKQLYLNLYAPKKLNKNFLQRVEGKIKIKNKHLVFFNDMEITLASRVNTYDNWIDVYITTNIIDGIPTFLTEYEKNILYRIYGKVEVFEIGEDI